MTKSFSFLLLFVSLLSFAQIKFETGYFILNDGTKKECLIKNIGWKNHPSEILFKESDNSEVKTIGINSVKEFSVSDVKFIRFNVKVDESATSNLETLDRSANPVWVNKTAFLKLVSDTDTQLYKYAQNDNEKYFIKKPNSDNVEQLVYKQYIIDQSGKDFVTSNNNNRLQLDSLGTQKSTSSLNYNEKSLVKWFAQNSGKDNQEIKNSNNGKLNIKVKPGMFFSNIDFTKPSTNFTDVETKSKASFSASVELEYVFGFNKSKWSIFIEPTYHSYKDEGKTTVTRYSINFTRSHQLDFQSVLLPIGVKHYMFVNDNSKLFLAAAFVTNINLKNDVSIWDENVIRSSANNYDYFKMVYGLQLGLGYVYNNKFSIEGKYISMGSKEMGETKLNGSYFGLFLGYNFF